MISHSWTSPTGITRDLSISGVGRVWLSDQGIEGMGAPKTDAFTSRSAARDGQRLTGTRLAEREVFWPVVIDGTDGSWLELQRTFWAALPIGLTGRWRVTDPTGNYRELYCRFVSDGGAAIRVDPSVRRIEVYGVTLVADDPWWRGPAIERVYQTAADELPFFSASPTAVLNIGSANTVAAASVTNPGEIDAWPVWRVNGPASGFSIGVGGRVISGTIAIAAGQYLLINTDPLVQLAQLYVGGVPTVIPFSAFSSIQFAGIPDGENVPLSLTVNGAGSLGLSFRPAYRRAF